VILLILPLEGALRGQFRGAFAPVVLAIPVESVREVFRFSAFESFTELGPLSKVTSVTFRIGMMAIIGAVAGAMARNLHRESAQAERRAVALEILAERERAARRESNAFQNVLLAGVSAEGLVEGLDSMIAAIAGTLGYERIAVLLLDDDGVLTPIALHGFTEDVRRARADVRTGISGAVVRTGRAEIVPDVSRDDRYFAVDPRTRSQVTLPIRAAGRIIGVLDVESSEVDAFHDSDVQRLERLSEQMALVIENARLLASERETVEQLRQLDTMKSDFIAIASHELRTPLTAMQGSIKTLLSGRVDLDPAVATELLQILDRQADRLERLVEELLVASRVDAGRIDLQMTSVGIGQVLNEVMEEIGAQSSRVSLAVSPSLPRMVTDPQRVGQIARNLIENALKFSPQNRPVRVTAQRGTEGMILEVADEGPGIPSEELARIFDRFHQVGGSMRRRGEGLGLGLYITRSLIEALGGTIAVDSTVGAGTTFRVTLPLASAEAAGSA
jgi:signal transduction histidine kinase